MSPYHVDGPAAGDRHPDIDRQVLGPWHHGDVLQPVASVVDRWRTLEVLALEVEGLFVEALQQELKLLLEVFAVGLGIEERCAEGFDLATVIAAADAHDHTAVRHDVGHRVVFGQPDGMPHRQDVEGAAELQALGLGGEPQAELHQIGQAFVALALEVVLGRPQRVVAEIIHEPRHFARRFKDLAQALVGIAALVGGRSLETDIVELDLADIDNVESLDHVTRSPRQQ